MANHGRRTRLGFSTFRSRQQAARDRRFCMTWINRTVNKQVEKRIAELRSEFFLMGLDLFEMVDEIHAQWLEAMAQVLSERSLHHTTVDREWKTSSWRRQMEEENREEDDAEPLDGGTRRVLVKKMVLKTFLDVFADGNTSESETSSSDASDVSPDGHTSDRETNDTQTDDVSPDGDTSDRETNDTQTDDVSPDGDTSDSKTNDTQTGDVSTDGDTSSQPAKWDQQENPRISTDPVAGTSQMMNEKEGKISKNPFHGNPSSMTSEGEKERVLMNGTNEEEALLMDREWREWMDEQEMRGKVKPVDQQNAEEQGGAAPPAPERETKKKKVKGVATVKKIKMCLGDLFHPQTYHKWERFEDED